MRPEKTSTQCDQSDYWRLAKSTSMKSNFIFSWLTLIFVVFSSCLRAEIEFSGFSISPASQLFFMSDKEGDKSSGWFRIGQSFRGYTLKSFDKNREIITVQKDGLDLEIRLKESKINDGKITIEGTVSIGNNQKIEGIRVSLFIGEESIIQFSESTRLAITPTRLANGNMKYSTKFITTTEGKEVILAAPALVTLPSSSFSVRVGEYGYSFDPQK